MTPLIAGFEPFIEGEGYPGEVGFKFKISLKKLGRNLNKLRKNPLLQAALKAGAQAMSNPMLAAVIPAPYAIGIKAGIAALAVHEKAKAGDPAAQRVVAQAESAPGDAAVTASTSSVAEQLLCPTCGQVRP